MSKSKLTPEVTEALTEIFKKNKFSKEIIESYLKSTVDVENANGYSGFDKVIVFSFSPEPSTAGGAFLLTRRFGLEKVLDPGMLTDTPWKNVYVNSKSSERVPGYTDYILYELHFYNEFDGDFKYFARNYETYREVDKNLKKLIKIAKGELDFRDNSKTVKKLEKLRRDNNMQSCYDIS